jgi:glutamate/tyrosine decarboxylase-like PLP-dependent enzyme
MSDLFDDAAKRARRYLESLNTRSVAPEKDAIGALSRFDQSFPNHTSSAESVLAELDEIGSPATMASVGGRFFGFVIGGALPATVAANWLATTWDQNAGLVVTSPANAELERVSLRWRKDIFHLPMQCAGGFVTSATAANFSALAAARHALLARAGWVRSTWIVWCTAAQRRGWQ